MIARVFYPFRLAAALVAALAIALSAGVPTASAQTFTVFDQTFTRETGAPRPVSATVTPPAPGPFKLRIVSAGAASAVVELNGVAVAAPRDFSAGPRTLEKTVTLRAANTLSVEVRGAPGGTVRVFIAGEDRVGPVISAVAAPAPNSSGWNSGDVVVTFQCVDSGSGVAACPPPVTLTTEGRGQVVTGTAVDRAGNTSTARAVVSIDKTAPSITGVPSPAANAPGWHNSDVRVVFACEDALSEVAECTAPVSVAAAGGEGTHDVPGAARDQAGNAATASVRVNIDITPPTIVATPDRAPDAGAWYTAPVTVSFTCADDRSGVATCPEPVRVVEGGAGVSVPGTAVDRAGNTASVAFVLNMRIGGSAPGLTASLAPLPNAAGWNRTDVTVTFACEDSGSGIQSCPPPQTVSAEGVTEITATASDSLGNTRTIEVIVRLDTTPPAIRAIVSPPNPVPGSEVTVSFECADETSGIAVCPPPIVTSPQGNQTISGTAIDVAGNSAVATVSLTVDQTPPGIVAAISPVPNAAGWNNTAVTVTFTCTAGASAIATCPAPVTVAANGAGQWDPLESTCRHASLSIL